MGAGAWRVRSFAELAELVEDGEEGRAAQALLVERGITDTVVGEAQALLDRIHTVESDPDDAAGRTYEEQIAAEDAMWRWYIEWSTIARTVIKDDRAL